MARTPYRPVPNFVRERFTIAILCDERLQLHWRDEEGAMAHVAALHPRELVSRDGMDYLAAETAEGECVEIRLDLIENLPTPVK
ncbi:hypothetical protein HUS23_06095 [Ectothiorhodospiraceae bacterium 2226]|nr:hypothetical protein HUS23_06095 [Ectothiorhodospiraceae bacterium 2226]